MTSDLFLMPAELARRWRRSGQTLANWRSRRVGPPYIKLGRRVLYRLSEIEAVERGATYSRPEAATSDNSFGKSTA